MSNPPTYYRTLAFTVNALAAPKPVGPPRPRSTGAQNYSVWRTILQLKTRPLFIEPLRGAVCLAAHFCLPTPGSWGERMIEAAVSGQLPHLQKPDLKNLVAGVEDALNKVAWLDDAQVVEYERSTKRWVTDDAVACVIAITPMDRADVERIRYPET